MSRGASRLTSSQMATKEDTSNPQFSGNREDWSLHATLLECQFIEKDIAYVVEGTEDEKPIVPE